MSYKIPKNLSTYKESFLFGLSFKTFLYFLVYALAVAYILKNFGTSLEAGNITIVVSLVVLCTFILIFTLAFKIEEKIDKANKLMSSSRNIGYFDFRMKYFMGVDKIKDNIVYLRNKKVLGLLEVKPIEFSVMDGDNQNFVLKMYEKWLKNLTYPVQIVSRSTEVDMTRWIKNMEASSNDKKRFDSLKSFLETNSKNNNVRNRVFYVVIPYSFKTKELSRFDRFLVKIGASKKMSQYHDSLSDFNNRIEDNVSLLRNIGLRVRRLSTEDLIGLYSSYFTDQNSSSESYLTEYMSVEGKK